MHSLLSRPPSPSLTKRLCSVRPFRGTSGLTKDTGGGPKEPRSETIVAHRVPPQEIPRPLPSRKLGLRSVRWPGQEGPTTNPVRTGSRHSTAVSAMITKAAVEEALDPPGFYSRTFTVPKHTAGWRPTIDLSPLNQFVEKTKFKMETPNTDQASRKFLHFVWESRTYQFRALCFGLSTAPQVFTRVRVPVPLLCRQRGIRLIRFLDD